MATEHCAAAVLLGATAVIFLSVSPLEADGELIWHWSDLLLVPVTLGGVLWLRRQRRDYEKASVVPPTATLASETSVIRRYAAWGTPYLLFALFVAATTPDFFGTGIACAVFAGAVALEARHAVRWEAATGTRLYRGRAGWRKPAIHRMP